MMRASSLGIRRSIPLPRLPDMRRVGNALLPVAVLLAVVAAWAGAVRLFAIPDYLLPSPEKVFQRIVHDRALFWKHSLATLPVIVIGFLVSVVFGVLLALAVVLNRTAERALMPLIVGSQTIPKIAIAPLFVVWLGFGLQPKVAVTFLITFFPVVVATIAGLKAVEPDMLDMVRSMGASPTRTMLKVQIPTALPQFFSGLKIAITSAVVGAIVAEFVGSDTGLGYLLLTSTATLDGSLVWSALLILVVIGVALFAIIARLEKAVIPWHVSIRSNP
jgi:NitT/TauT family transport system permease protein